jgi:hypothetical protein
MSPPPGTPTLPAPPAPVLRTDLALLPPILPYRTGLPVPAGYRVVDRAATGLMIGGGATFGVAYLAGLALAAGQGFGNGTAYTTIPVAGPWAAIGGRSFKCQSTAAVGATESSVQNAINKCVGTAFDEVTTVVFLTADGLVQATGAVLFFVGLASGYQELEREDLPKPDVAVLPGGGMAFSLHGSF